MQWVSNKHSALMTQALRVYVVAYVEVMPASATEAAALLRRYGKASRTDAGLLALEVLQQYARPDHFAIVERGKTRRLSTPTAAPRTRAQCTNGYRLSAAARTMSVYTRVSLLAPRQSYASQEPSVGDTR
jgi:hypothetical protein